MVQPNTRKLLENILANDEGEVPATDLIDRCQRFCRNRFVDYTVALHFDQMQWFKRNFLHQFAKQFPRSRRRMSLGEQAHYEDRVFRVRVLA